jgi:hypothetical protein
VYTHLARLLDLDHGAKYKPWSWVCVERPDGCVARVGVPDPALTGRLLATSARPVEGARTVADCERAWASWLDGGDRLPPGVDPRQPDPAGH